MPCFTTAKPGVIGGVKPGLGTVRAASVANIVGTYNSATLGGQMTGAGALPAVDGVSLIAGDLVLLTAQTTASQNGVFQVIALNPFDLRRPSPASNADPDYYYKGRLWSVSVGTTNAGKQKALFNTPGRNPVADNEQLLFGDPALLNPNADPFGGFTLTGPGVIADASPPFVGTALPNTNAPPAWDTAQPGAILNDPVSTFTGIAVPIGNAAPIWATTQPGVIQPPQGSGGGYTGTAEPIPNPPPAYTGDKPGPGPIEECIMIVASQGPLVTDTGLYLEGFY